MHTDRRRGEPRFAPSQSVSAVLLEGSTTLSQGVLVDISESGARLVTNVGVDSGRLVRLRLRSPRSHLLDTRALTIWSSQGVETTMELVGARQGIQFAMSSELERSKVRRMLTHYGEQQRTRILGFDLLFDPDIEALIAEQVSTPLDPVEELSLALRPYFDRLVRKVTSDS